MDSVLYLPYVHALLKTFSEKDSQIKENYNWLDPIFQNNTAENLLAGREGLIDVFGISCYLWNWDLQLEMARRVKEKNPNCLVVAGGPHPDWRDSKFFEKFPQIDIVVKNEGEIPFHLILKERLKPQPNYKIISSLILPSNERACVHTGEAYKIHDWDIQSVWNTDEMRSIAERYYGKATLAAAWETNRGCPYQCSFCDWGSATYSKIRHLPESRLAEDLKFFGENKVNKIFIADSNFGMFERDLSLADQVVKCKKDYGFPTLVYWAPAKNKAESIAEIAKSFLDSGLDDSVVIALQSTQENTVVEMGRGAHSLKTHQKLSKMVDELGAPKIAQILLGSPGESFEEFQDSLHGTIEMNFHQSIFVMNYTILPNAPITRPEQTQKYEIKTISRPTNRIWGHKKLLWKWSSGTETIIVGHNKLPTQGWADMSVYKTHIMCMHHLGLTRYLSRILRNVCHVSYADFYRFLFCEALSDRGHVGECYKKIQDHFEDYLTNEAAIYALNGNDSDWYIDHESALFCWLMQKNSKFNDWLQATMAKFVIEKSLDAELVKEAVNYQIQMTISPDYESERGRDFKLEYDFETYFKKIKYVDNTDVALEKKSTSYSIREKSRDLKDQLVHFDWHKNEEVDYVAYQHSAIVRPYRRYMSAPVFNAW